MKRKKHLLLALAVLLVLSGVFTGCSSKAQETGKTEVDPDRMLKVAELVNPSTTDVQKNTEYYNVPLNIYDRLVEAETVEPGKSDLVPGLAEKWDISADGLVYTFHLRKGVKFHNGEELKADDVLFTFDRMLDPATKALNTDFLDMIAGAKDRMDGKADSVSGLKVIDDYTIQITLEQPFAPFLANIATPAGSIYNRKATTAAGEQFGLDPKLTIGTGPFVFDSWTLNDQMILVANKDYFKGAPKLAGVIIKIVPDAETQRMLFETGELDVFDCDNARSQIPYFEGSEKWKNQMVSGPRVGLHYYCINEGIKPLEDVRVRKALQMAIDRETLLEKLFYGKGVLADGIMPIGLVGHNPELEKITYDPEKARALLVEAGYPDGFDMVISQISDRPASLKMNEAVQSMLGDVGIKAEIRQMDEASWFATRKEGKLPCYYTDWSADFNDPDNFMYTFFYEKNSVARSFNYINKDVSDRLVGARAMTVPEERYAEYQALEKKIVVEDAAWIPLFSLDHLFVVQPRVKNFQVSWNGWSSMPYRNITIEP
ncbi:MAG TPA: ABC transporter substrate-binding protein [Clostridia bacterium]|nr:ABC transporter substrate-binding protein [Clostridia bacterium]